MHGLLLPYLSVCIHPINCEQQFSGKDFTCVIAPISLSIEINSPRTHATKGTFVTPMYVVITLFYVLLMVFSLSNRVSCFFLHFYIFSQYLFQTV